MNNKIIIALIVMSLVTLVAAIELTPQRNEQVRITRGEDTLLRDANITSDNLKYDDYSTGEKCWIHIQDRGLNIEESYDCETQNGTYALTKKLKEIANVTAERNARIQRVPDEEVTITG